MSIVSIEVQILYNAETHGKLTLCQPTRCWKESSSGCPWGGEGQGQQGTRSNATMILKT